MSYERLALAQAAPGAQSTNTIAEVVVTARKRQESLQRIPVAVTAETGAQLAQQRITNVSDLTRVAPSLLASQSSSSDDSTQIQLRAQSATDSLLGLSQPVGLYEDSVNIPHPKGSGMGFVDLQRVEILNGPQGTLYGRNTTGGAVNIITRNANYNGFHGYVEGEVGNFDDYRGQFAINIPIIPDVLAARVAYQHWSQQGFGKSVYTGQHFGNDHDDDLARLSVKFDPTSKIDVNAKFEYGRANRTSPMIAPMTPPPGGTANAAMIALSVLQPATYNSLFAAGNIPGIVAAGTPLVANCFGNWYTNCSTTHQFDRVTEYHGVLDAKWDVTDNMQLRSITGLHKSTNFSSLDLGGMPGEYNVFGIGVGGAQPTTGIPLTLPIIPDQQYTQWTQEFNASGKYFDGKLDWLVGAFASWDKGSGAQQYAVQFAAPGIVPVPRLASGYAVGSLDGTNNQSDTYAFFTQNDYHFSKKLSVTFGARYTDEKLVQDFTSWSYNPSNGTYTCGNGAQFPVAGNYKSCETLPYYNGYSGFDSAGNPIPKPGYFTNAESSGTSYLLSLNYQATDAVLFYLKTARGFRGGAFGRNPQPPAKPEIDVDYEFGMKGDFFERRLRVDLALYQTNYSNKQEASATCTQLAFGQAPPPGGCSGLPGVGTFTTDITNAAAARIRGVELQFQARPTEQLSLWGSATYTDAKYVNFPNAPIEAGGTADLSGFTLTSTNPSGAPLWKIDVGARYEWNIGPGVLGAQGDYAYRTSLPITPLNQDPNMPLPEQRYIDRAVGLLAARLDYNLPNYGLNVAIWGTNLTNVAYGYVGLQSTYINGVGTAATAPPRTFGFTVRKTFGAE
jgi:iron complex outermembrane receptor protein